MARSKKRGKRNRQYLPLFRTAQNENCFYCREFVPVGFETFDHFVPLDKNGADDWTNGVMACDPCNSRKANRMPAQHRQAEFMRVQRCVALMIPTLRAKWAAEPHKPRSIPRAHQRALGGHGMTSDEWRRVQDRAEAQRQARLELEAKFGLAPK